MYFSEVCRNNSSELFKLLHIYKAFGKLILQWNYSYVKNNFVNYVKVTLILTDRMFLEIKWY